MRASLPAYSWVIRSIVSSGIPVISLTRDGGYSCSRDFSWSNPMRVSIDVILILQTIAHDDVHHAESQRAVRAGHDRQCARPIARRSCVRRGSMVTILAPRDRAFRMYRQRWIFEVMMLEPQIRMYFA